VLIVGLAMIAAVAVGVSLAWRLALRDSTEPASIDVVLRRFREQAAASSGRIPPGVYVYATTGFESVSALGGSRHAYPARSTITVTRAPCGVRLRWDALTTRINTLTVCADGQALRLARWSEQHEFFGRADRTDWQCEETAWLPADPVPGSASPLRCRGADSTQDGTVSVVGPETVLVGRSLIRAVHVRAEAREAGGARGVLVDEHWLEPTTGLPLRIVYRVRTENPSLIGDVTFEERYVLRLLSLEPRR
jgi:hypothetical protein